MTALDDALRAYRRACDDARRLRTLWTYGRASARDLDAARQRRDAAYQRLRAAETEGAS